MTDNITRTSLEWIDNLSFEAEVNGFHFMIDSSPEHGGSNRGMRPKPLLLAALSGCSGMDVVSILNKMKVSGYKLKMEMEADSTSEHPKTYHTIRMKYVFTGDNIPPDKVIRAVELSGTTYCGVNAMLKNSAIIQTSIKINDKDIWHD